MTVDMDSKILAGNGHATADLEGETIVLSDRSGEYFGFDAVGTRIWELVREPVTASQIVETIQKEFDVEPGRCQSEVLEFVRELEVEGLIEVCEARPEVR